LGDFVHHLVDHLQIIHVFLHLFEILGELVDQRTHLKLIASENYASPEVLLAMGNWLSDKYAEGAPGHRLYAGCDNVDVIESRADELACALFGADHAYAQPHSGIDANLVAFWAVLSQRVESPALERLTAARPYAIKMGELLSGLVGRTEGDAHPLLARRTTGRKRLVVITADKGLCGAFNSNILRASLAFLREQGNVDVTLVVVGRKARDFYRRRSWQVKSEMLGVFDRLAYAHAQELANELMQSYLAEDVDEVSLMYNEFRSVAVQRVTRQQLLPIEAEAAEAGHGTAGGGTAGGDYLFEPSPDAILASLLPRHVTTQVFRALMESVAGEYGARMTAM
jgi:F-type H+-transporting ATPase subunit gamma